MTEQRQGATDLLKQIPVWPLLVALMAIAGSWMATQATVGTLESSLTEIKGTLQAVQASQATSAVSVAQLSRDIDSLREKTADAKTQRDTMEIRLRKLETYVEAQQMTNNRRNGGNNP